MDIGIIGAGRIGSTLAGRLAAAGHHIAIANSHDPRSLDEVVHPINGKFTTTRVRATTPDGAADFGEVVIVAIPFGRIRDLPAAHLAGKLVVDAMNYSPERDGHIDELDNHDRTSSGLVQEYLGGARLVKAFNTMRWDHLRDYGLEGGTLYRYGIPVASDDDDAKYTVLNLVNDIGFDPVDAGDLATGGRALEPDGEVFAADLRANDLADRLGASRGAAS